MTTAPSIRLSQATFIRYTAAFTLAEGVLVGLAARSTYHWRPTYGLLLTAFAAELVSILVFKLSDDPAISALGVVALSIALGVVLGPVLAYYTFASVLDAVFITCGIMVGMSLVGLVFPRAFLGFGGFLIGGLWLLVAALFSQTLLSVLGVPAASSPILTTWLTWAGIVIFTFLVAYDWNAALTGSLTVDAAIDASGGLVLDAVNLFIRILSLFGNKGSN